MQVAASLENGDQLAHRLGLLDATVTPHTVLLHYGFVELLWGGHLTRAQEAGVVTPSDVQEWWDDLRQAHKEDRFFAGLTAFVVTGTKP